MFAVMAVLLAGCFGPSPIKESWEFGGLKLTLSSPKSYYERGERVSIRAMVENASNQPITLRNNPKSSEYVFDVAIDDVFFLSSQFPELATHERTLAPGEKIEIEYSFTPSPSTITIKITAYTYYDNGVARNSAPITIRYGEPPY